MSNYGICSYLASSRRFATLTGRLTDDRRLKPISGARVVLYVQGVEEPLVSITNRFGDFAFVNIPIRARGPTCGWQVITAPGYGRFLRKAEPWAHGSFVQSPTLIAGKPQISYGGSVCCPNPCLHWKPAPFD